MMTWHNALKVSLSIPVADHLELGLLSLRMPSLPVVHFKLRSRHRNGEVKAWL